MQLRCGCKSRRGLSRSATNHGLKLLRFETLGQYLGLAGGDRGDAAGFFCLLTAYAEALEPFSLKLRFSDSFSSSLTL